MIDREFEWDDAKAARNLRKHGVSFEVARKIFRDPVRVDQPDRREHYGEERYNTIGMAEGRLLLVAYTIRNERIRIISARTAEPQERRRYHEEKED